jgi:tRNA1Val (adenine37-N6)-methyltransferase
MMKEQNIVLKQGERIDRLEQARLQILQKEDGFRFGMDAILLDSFVRADKRDRCADFGTGTGILALLLAGRGRAAHVDAFEIQSEMADMAQRSVQLNHLTALIDVHAMSVEQSDQVLAPCSIDVIVCNPPYGHHGTTLPNPDESLSMARHQQKDGLASWFKAAYRLLRGKGRIALIYPAARMLEVMKLLEKAGLTPKRFQLVYPSADKAANLVLIEALKDAKPMLHPEPPLVIYEADGTLTKQLQRIYAME